jgi:ABC-type multidrug transport system fused ATPase/permease subunit
VLIYKSLKSQVEGRTTLIITYRLNIVRDANKIIVLEKGEVVERGSYTKLLS